MQELIITLLLAAHLLAMNVASAGPLVGAWLGDRGHEQRQSGRRFYKFSLLALCLGSLLGGALLLAPSENMSAALRRFPADAYWYAGVELAFSAGCIAALIAGGERLARRRWASLGLALLSTMNLLYHFPPLMAVLGELAADPHWTATAVIERAALLRLWRRPEILALWTHFVLASFAVACIAALWFRIPTVQRATDSDDPRIAPWLGGVALVATAMQIPVGLWLVSASSGSERSALMGGQVAATLCFAGGVGAAFWLLQTLLAVTLGEGRRAAVRAGCLVIVVTLLMTASLRESRGASGADRPLAASAVASNPSDR